MDVRCKVVYYHHSGFTAEVNNTLCVFDYWEGPEGTLDEGKKLTNERLNKYDQVYFFTSHTHPDHMDPVIYTFETDKPIIYITSFDTPVGMRGRRIALGDDVPLGNGVRVKGFASTDTGVSYLVDLHGVRVFHAGDLNLWHWRAESSLREIEAAEKAYEEAVIPIAKEVVDIAMFPVDPRQGAMFDAGANYFILTVKPKVFIPMHWQGRAEVAIDYARRATNKQTAVFALTKPREKLEVSIVDGVLNIEVYNAQEQSPKREAAKTVFAKEEVVRYTSDDPFAESDLPIDIGSDGVDQSL